MVLDALRDRNLLVRRFVISAMKKYGTSDMIPALEHVVETAPEVDGGSDRKSAAEAIASIQNRAGKHQR